MADHQAGAAVANNQIIANVGNNGTNVSSASSTSPLTAGRADKSIEPTRSPQSTTSSDDTDSPAPSAAPNSINKSKTMIDIRHGITLRRVSPQKRPITVKQDGPLRGVVLRKVEKKSLLEPPKTPRFEKSPPPKKLTNKNKAKNHNAASNRNNANAIPKSKSTNDVALMAKQQLEAAAAAAAAASKGKHKVPQVNLLKTMRPLEIHKIEGDKIIIIRRVPKSKRPKEPLLPPIPDGDPQVTRKQKTKTRAFHVISSRLCSIHIISEC